MKKKQPKPLTPENYIKTRARTLPLDQCFVNAEWKETGLANVIVTRKHTNGNLTFGVYLVDMYALGTKDTFFYFNQPLSVINKIFSSTDFVQLDYVLAHNIIYGGNVYAEDHGFKIHKDFAKLTQYILEIDDERVPLIDLVFGKDGKPVIIDISGHF